MKGDVFKEKWPLCQFQWRYQICKALIIGLSHKDDTGELYQMIQRKGEGKIAYLKERTYKVDITLGGDFIHKLN